MCLLHKFHFHNTRSILIASYFRITLAKQRKSKRRITSVVAYPKSSPDQLHIALKGHEGTTTHSHYFGIDNTNGWLVIKVVFEIIIVILQHPSLVQ
jgi:hypothetical protein